MQVCEKYALHVAPLHIYLVQTLQSTPTGIEEQLLASRFHQDAGSESIHYGRWTTRTQERNPDFRSLSPNRDSGRQHDNYPDQSAKQCADHLPFSLFCA
jgi:hypothetical protein